MKDGFSAVLGARLSSKAILTENEPLAPITSFCIGGPAEYLLLPATEEDVIAGVEAAVAESMPWRMLGSGSNCIIPDAGLPGLTIKMWHQFSTIETAPPFLSASAGADMLTVAREAAKAGLSGLEWACGIPGTIGGAIYMNAGVKKQEIRDTLVSGRVILPSGSVTSWDLEDFQFSYRTSRLQHETAILLSATFKLQPDEPEAIFIRMNEHLAMRSRSQPIHHPNCGSVFRNPEGDFAGRLIESVGLKGHTIGGVQVSEQHANFIVNRGNGTASDVLALIALIKETVLEQTGVELREEVRSIT